ncbi:AGAP006814-PA-like protein [Anopheles sinensis]|uniref:AGAP006814-PA-like protein n=1 Tax=Anopheles sinensis TaxID=74873 RepID=A0A084WMU3_ANOSI|nr:AGAP006814-PA-like protein [Anopheles sinensis]
MAESSDENPWPLPKVEDDHERSRSPLETVKEEAEAEGYQPILVSSKTDWKTVQLLVEDSHRASLTPSLELALRHFLANCKKDVREISRCDLMIVLIYVIALESGLIPAGASLPEKCRPDKAHIYRTFDVRLVKHFATRLPMGCFRDASNVYRLEMVFAYGDIPGSRAACEIVARPSGDSMIVNLISNYTKMISTNPCTLIPLNFHVPSINTVRLPLCFQSLKQLSVKLKNDLFVPFVAMMYQQFIPIINPSLTGLPQELKDKISAYKVVGQNLKHIFLGK